MMLYTWTVGVYSIWGLYPTSVPKQNNETMASLSGHTNKWELTKYEII